MAEASIRQVKQRLFAYMRFKHVTNWPELLKEVTDLINQSPCVSIGYLAPNDIKTRLDEPRVRLAQQKLAAKMSQKQRERYFPRKDSFREMVKLSKEYDQKDQKFPVGCFVYLDIIKSPFEKSTGSEKRGQVFIVETVIKNRSIKRFKLMNLDFKILPGTFYEQNLRKVPPAAHPTNPKSYE